jgi:hypothetical protein
MAEHYFNYFTEVEEHFQRVRGSGSIFLLSPVDFARVGEWKKLGIPLEAVLRGIDVAFERWGKRRAKTRTQTINSIAYCEQAVLEEAQMMAAAAPSRLIETDPQFSLDKVRQYIAHRAGVFREAGHNDLADVLDALDLDALYGALEELEQQLTEIERELIAKLRASATDEFLSEARKVLDLQLKPYRGKMSTDQLAMLEKQFFERHLLEAAGLPRLSLFYLS